MTVGAGENPPQTPPGSPTAGAGIRVVSARTSSNPFAALHFGCATVKTREHAQFAGCLSFALFICLTVVSFIMFDYMAIVYIVTGIMVYAFLAEALFRQPKACAVLCYLIFEIIQIGFYISYIIFLFAALIFYQNDDDDSHTKTTTTTITTTATTTTVKSITTKPLAAVPSSPSGFFLEMANNVQPTTDDGEIELTATGILFYIMVYFVLTLVKAYFMKVFLRYYKFVCFQERHSSHLRAQYVNGRGVNIGFPAVNPEFDNPITNDPFYGYGVQPHSTPTLPTYHEAMSTAKPSAPSRTSTTTESTSSDNPQLQAPYHNV